MAELISLSITQSPNKTRYVEGDRFERYGMVVRANYSDGTSSQIDNYSYSPTSALTPSITRVSVSFGGKTTHQDIIVSNAPTTGYFMNKCIGSSELNDNPCVNAADGSIRFRCSPFSVESGPYGLSVSLVYNSRMTSRESDMIKGMMRGLRTNWHQFLVQDGYDESGNSTYKYIDGDGYIHTFVLNQGLNAHYDKECKGLMLDISSKTITDSANNVLSFNQSGRLISIKSGLNPADVKVVEYNSDGLRMVYDERNPNTYIKFSYEFSYLRWIKVYYDGELLRTYTLNGFLGQITSIDESAGNETRTLYQLSVNDRDRVNRFVDCLTKEAYRFTYVFDGELNDYRFESLRNGYMENGTFVQHEGLYFLELRTDPVVGYGIIQTLVTIDDNEIEMSYMMDSEGALVSAFERDHGVFGSYRSLIEEQGLWIPFSGTCLDSINDSRAFAVSSGLVDIGYGLRPTDLDGEKHLKLVGYVKVMERPKRVRLSMSAQGISPKDADVNPRAYGVWQYFEIPFKRDVDASGHPIDFSSFRLSANREGPSPLNVEFADLQWAKGVPERKFFLSYRGDVKQFDDISAVRVYTSYYDYTTVDISSSPFFMSPEDFLSTMRRYYANPNQPRAAILCDGRELIHYYPMIVGVTNDGPIGLFNPFLPYDDDIDTGSAFFYAETAESSSRTYYRFREGYYEIIARQDALNEAAATIHYDTVRRYAYDGRLMLEEFPDGRSFSFEYFQDGRLMRKTVEYTEGGIRRSTIVYEAIMGPDDRRIVEVRQEGATIGIEYVGYLESRRIISSPGQQDASMEKTHNAFGDEVWGIDFKEGGILRESHGYSRPSMSYKTNYLSDGQYGYRVSNSISARSTSFGIRSGASYQDVMTRFEFPTQVLETFNNSHSGQDTSHSVSRLFDGYGKAMSESCDGIQKAIFEYGDNYASRFVSRVSGVTDSYSGRDVGYEYDSRNELSAVHVGLFGASFRKDGDTSVIRESFNDGDEEYECTSSFKECEARTGSGALIRFSKRTYLHDALGAVSSKEASSPSMTQKYVYSTDYQHRVVRYTFGRTLLSSGYNESYEYDALGRLSGVSMTYGSVSKSVSYCYDALGRIVRAERNGVSQANEYLYGDGSTGPLGRMISFKGTVMSYDGKGRLIGFGAKSYSYDAYGNMTSRNGVAYSWERGTLLSSAGLCSFTYDYKGIRSSKTDQQGNHHEYYYVGGRLVGEDITRNGSPVRKLRYFYDLDGLCSLRVIDSFGLTNDYAYIRNPFGDIMGLCGNSGVVALYLYDEWGNHSVCRPDGTENDSPSFIGNINPFRYRGYYYDAETSLYYITSRYYDPEIGRFVSPDSVDYLEPITINGLNLYAYCGNDPINYYDPSGHIATELIAGGVAIYYLLAGLAILVIGTGVVIASQGGFKNISFDVPFEWQVAWDTFSDNISNVWSNISYWWNGLFDYTSNLASQETEVNNSYSLIDYYLLQSIQDPYARPNQKKQGRELKNKARARFTTKSKFRSGRKPPKHHTPGRGHRKYIWWLLWRILNHEEDDEWWYMD